MAKPVITENFTEMSAKGSIECVVGNFSLSTSWDIEMGEVLVLFGPSGAGKSTTLRSIAGLLRPLRGYIEVGGKVVYDSDNSICLPAHQRRVGYLTQTYHLFPHLKVAGNIAFGLRNQKSETTLNRIKELVRLLQLDGLEDRFPCELSGGQQQRVALARALAPYPTMLLLDEPFASLDSELRRKLHRELREMLVQTPVPVMLVTHDREEALALGDSVQVINDGHVLTTGNPLEILGQPGQGRVARLVGVENIFDLTITRRNPKDGTMTCSGQGLNLEVPLDFNTIANNTPDGEDNRVTVGIRASDIIIAKDALIGSSARNQIEGHVMAIEPRPPGYTVILNFGTGDLKYPLRCHITGSALEELAIESGQKLWAVFKASSCFLVDAHNETNFELTD